MTSWMRAVGMPESFANLTGHNTNPANAGVLHVAAYAPGTIEPWCHHTHYNAFRFFARANSCFAVPTPSMALFEALLYYTLYPAYEPPHLAVGAPAAGNVVGIPMTPAQYAMNYPKQLGEIVPFLRYCLNLGAPGEEGIAAFLHTAWLADGSIQFDWSTGAHRHGTVFALEYHLQDLTKGLDLSIAELFRNKDDFAEVVNRAFLGPPTFGGSYNGPTQDVRDGPRFRAVCEGGGWGKRPSIANVDKMASDPNVALGNPTPCIIVAMDRNYPNDTAANSAWFLHRCVRFLDFLGPCVCPSRTYKWCLGMGVEGQVPGML
mmetsp:Transcript_3834/g.12546  ORF Transcript_3834/g.12546 Transcript_3834/m.12546 type:complete len:318 (+) Transcript_3834:566-1519(+)